MAGYSLHITMKKKTKVIVSTCLCEVRFYTSSSRAKEPAFYARSSYPYDSWFFVIEPLWCLIYNNLEKWLIINLHRHYNLHCANAIALMSCLYYEFYTHVVGRGIIRSVHHCTIKSFFFWVNKISWKLKYLTQILYLLW